MSSYTPDPGLGTFAKLPPELRLCIYDYMPPMLYRCQKKPHRGRRPGFYGLAILLTSRKLYNEVTHHLHIRNYLVFYVRPTLDVDCHWVSARMPRLFHYKWKFKNPDSVMQLGFASFPFHRVEVRIRVAAPDPTDCRQLVVLWHRLNRLVDLLERASSVKSITFYFDPAGERTWVQDGQSLTSIRLVGSKYPDWFLRSLRYGLTRDMYDHEAVLLPLARLRNVGSMGIYFTWKCSKAEILTLDLSWPWFTRHCLTVHGYSKLRDKQKPTADRGRDSIPLFVREIDDCYYFILRDMLASDFAD
ncbi:hypothetical protein BJX70DRAFT_276163 [Aspergillus crustosus]